MLHATGRHVKRIPLTPEVRQRLLDAIEDGGFSDVDLERLTGIARTTFWRLRKRRPQSLERPTLLSLCAILAIPPAEVVDQAELTLGLDDEMIQDAARAFEEQLSSMDPELREEAAIEALVGMVGVLLRHGADPARRTYERLLAVRRARENSRSAA